MDDSIINANLDLLVDRITDFVEAAFQESDELKHSLKYSDSLYDQLSMLNQDLLTLGTSARRIKDILKL